jgi:LSD1 subclass zinc finger protein
MPKDLFSEIAKGARWIVQPVAGTFQRWRRSRRNNQALDQAFSLERDGKYAEAGVVYTRMADEYIVDNPLIYQLYSHDSFRMWLKAKNVDNAQRQADAVLHVLSDTDWIGRSTDAVDDLGKMVGELYVDGYVTEAGTLSNQINQQLKAHGMPPLRVSLETPGAALKIGPSASICPQCGGSLPLSNGADEIRCPYCNSIIHAS